MERQRAEQVVRQELAATDRAQPEARLSGRAASPSLRRPRRPHSWLRRWLGPLALAMAVCAWAPAAQAKDLTHVVVKGQTLGSIAEQYGTSVKTIETTNRLKPGKPIYAGQKLRIVGATVDPRGKVGGAHAHEQTKAANRAASPPAEPADERQGAYTETTDDDDAPPCDPRDPRSGLPGSLRRVADGAGHGQGKGAAASPADRYTRKPARPGWISMLRYGEVFRGQLVDGQGKVVPDARARISRLMRDLRAHKQALVDARLLRLVSTVSDHFGGRTIVIASGFREYTPRQYTRYSRHNEARALDFHIIGVPNEIVRDYCLSLPGVGVGYYPNSTFVHLDSRGYNARWVDYSTPGSAPRYTCRQVRAPSPVARAR